MNNGIGRPRAENVAWADLPTNSNHRTNGITNDAVRMRVAQVALICGRKVTTNTIIMLGMQFIERAADADVIAMVDAIEGGRYAAHTGPGGDHDPGE